MKRVLQASLTAVVASALIGFSATQTRADRIAFNSACVGAACIPSTFTARGIPLSFTDSSLSADSSLSILPELGVEASGTRSDLSVTPVSMNAAQSQPAGRTNRVQNNFAPDTFNVGGIIFLSFTGSRLTVDARSTTVADLGPQVSATHSANFSVAPANLIAQNASIQSTKGRSGMLPNTNIPGGDPSPNPEPTTLLLLGTGLLGTAAVFRRRLRVKRTNSKEVSSSNERNHDSHEFAHEEITRGS